MLTLILVGCKVETYEDKDGARDDEIAALGGQTATGTNVYSAFYDRLKEVCSLSFASSLVCFPKTCLTLISLGCILKIEQLTLPDYWLNEDERFSC